MTGSIYSTRHPDDPANGGEGRISRDSSRELSSAQNDLIKKEKTHESTISYPTAQGLGFTWES